MNRKKKIKQTLMKKAKKSNAKQAKSNKPKYISKAEREKLAQLPEVSPETDTETNPEAKLQTSSETNPASGAD